MKKQKSKRSLELEKKKSTGASGLRPRRKTTTRMEQMPFSESYVVARIQGLQEEQDKWEKEAGSVWDSLTSPQASSTEKKIK